MDYRHGQSPLGFGCMRFPRQGNGFDIDEIRREIKYAYENGVNYYDTAYIYPGSEEVLGTVVNELGIRSDIIIATKLPHYMMRNTEEMEKNFVTQLKRLKTDYVDNYLMHMLPDLETWNQLVERGAIDWLNDKKASGQIKNVGFSYHGSSSRFIELLDAYDWDFCQIQYNYMDENSQAGKAGLLAAQAKDIPVIIMEPLRGGKLAGNMPEAAKKIFNDAHPDWSIAEWSFRWLYNQEGVTTVLSGMNSLDMIKENIQIASTSAVNVLTEDDFAAYEAAKIAIGSGIIVPCTGCGYCMPCPAGVDIPGCFKALNDTAIDGFFEGFREYFMCTALKKRPAYASICKECGLCETKCPQHLAIKSELKKVKRKFDNPIFYIGKFFAKLFRFF